MNQVLNNFVLSIIIACYDDCDDIRNLLLFYPEVTMKHIYRGHNKMADSLSKKALSLESGFRNYMESLNGMIIDHGNFQLY